MLIRRENPENPRDAAAVLAITTIAFVSEQNPEPVETLLLEQLRKDAGWIPALSLIAVSPAGKVVGHVLGTRGRVGTTPAVGIGPLSVLPRFQGRGVGTALMHAVLGAAEALDEPLAALLGDPAYYGRFGFRPSTEHGVDAPDPTWGDSFQTRPLATWSPELRGTFRYAEPFHTLPPAEPLHDLPPT